MTAFLTRSTGARSQPDLRWLLPEKERPREVACPSACRSARTSAPPVESAPRAQRNCRLPRSVECLELLPIERLAGVPGHLAAANRSFPFRVVFGPALAGHPD